MNTCETVKVVRDSSDGHGEYTIINAEDFDKKIHKIYDPEAIAKAKAKAEAKEKAKAKAEAK